MEKDLEILYKLKSLSEKFLIRLEIDKGYYEIFIFNESKENEDYLFLSFVVEGYDLKEVYENLVERLEIYKRGRYKWLLE